MQVKCKATHSLSPGLTAALVTARLGTAEARKTRGQAQVCIRLMTHENRKENKERETNAKSVGSVTRGLVADRVTRAKGKKLHLRERSEPSHWKI